MGAADGRHGGRGWQAGGWGTGHARGTKARRKPEKAAGGSGACADERQADFVSAHPRFARDSYISPLQPPPSSLLHFPFLPVARPLPPDAHRPPTPRPRSGGSLLHGPATSRHSCLIPVPSPIAATSVTTHPDYTSCRLVVSSPHPHLALRHVPPGDDHSPCLSSRPWTLASHSP